MNKYPDFGKYLTYIESVKSPTAIRKGVLDNTPTPEEYANMARLYKNIYEPLCEYFGFKLPVTSFFRNKATNRAVKGSPTSDHLRGNAIDIDMDMSVRKVSNADLFNHAKDKLNFDQLIWEFGTDENPNWVHISYRGNTANKKEVWRAVSVNGKTTYKRLG